MALNENSFNTYEEAIEYICTISFVEWNHDKPLRTLNKIIENEVSIALNPKVSKQARDLIRKHGGTIDGFN